MIHLVFTHMRYFVQCWISHSAYVTPLAVMKTLLGLRNERDCPRCTSMVSEKSCRRYDEQHHILSTLGPINRILSVFAGLWYENSIWVSAYYDALDGIRFRCAY